MNLVGLDILEDKMLEKIEKNGYKNTILDDSWAKQLVWFGHLKRMDEERLPQKILNWIRTERRKRGRPKTRWKEGVLTAMEECGLRDGDWEDILRWRLGDEIRSHMSHNDYIHTYIQV
jgi:hypothetical protein